MKTSTSLLLALTLLLPATALAVPKTVGFSARLADNGRPVTGTHAFTFKVFDAETGGAELWGESKDLAVTDGVVTTALGDTVTIDALFTGVVALYLEVAVDGVALSPRMAIQSVPYALRAQSVPWSGVTDKPAFSCTQVTSSRVEIAAGGTGWTFAACPTNTLPVSGGFRCSEYAYRCITATICYSSYWTTSDCSAYASYSVGQDWYAFAKNNNATAPRYWEAYAVCCSLQ